MLEAVSIYKELEKELSIQSMGEMGLNLLNSCKKTNLLVVLLVANFHKPNLTARLTLNPKTRAEWNSRG
jgi:hypothetical protein